MPDSPSWTLDELVGRVAAALDSPAYPGARNGRVRDLPDRRVVRWYTTTGLVDRPAMQGRNAVYTTRQLLQIVAVKRLQAQGFSLADIQAELAGAGEDKLRAIAGVPDHLLGVQAVSTPTPEPARRARFWAEPPTEAATNGTSDADVTTLTAVSLPGGTLLLVPGQPDHDDIHAIRAAAAPLMQLLADRGLLALDERSSP